MKTKLLSLVLLLFLSIYGCKKETDISSTTTTTENQSAVNNVGSSYTFMYHNQTVSKSDFDTNNPDLVMAVSENNMVYVFDNNNDFMAWAKTTSHANDIVQLENRRQEVLAYEQESGPIHETSFIETSANKTDLLCALYENTDGGNTGSTKWLVIGYPYSSLGSMDNKASAINGLAVCTVCYDKTNFSGSRVYVLCAGALVYFSDLNFDNKTSSILSF